VLTLVTTTQSLTEIATIESSDVFLEKAPNNFYKPLFKPLLILNDIKKPRLLLQIAVLTYLTY